MPIDINFQSITSCPGVYIMKNKKGKTIYIGKANNLKKRVSSYFNKNNQSIKTDMLIKNVHQIETIITQNETEALLLESSLVKQYSPKYNIVLKDDKRYPLIRLDIQTDYPYLSIVRKVKKDGALYFGPYTSSKSVRQTLKVINKLFKLRKCRHSSIKKRTRPCLNYQIKTCLGPCFHQIDSNRYAQAVQEVILFLKGRSFLLIKQLKKQMKEASNQLDFEMAATLRDRIVAFEKIMENQIVIRSDDRIDKDIIGYAIENETILILLMSVRNGTLISTRNYEFSLALSTINDTIETFLDQHYEYREFIPREILLPELLSNIKYFESLLTQRRKKGVHLIVPQKGEKQKLIHMAIQNAENTLKEKKSQKAHQKQILMQLQKNLNMSHFPRRIECYDNSNCQGSHPVSARVVFINGVPDKSLYRHYMIQTVSGPDDYGTMEEVLTRRLTKINTQDDDDNGDNVWPDLIMVDGGRGQLSITLNVIEKLNFSTHCQVISIAKKKSDEPHDKIFIPNRSNPIRIQSDVLLFLQQIRDEAHRFAITFHRKKRSQNMTQSILDTIPGIGQKRKMNLIQYFGDLERLKQASTEDIANVNGITINLAKSIQETLNR